MKVVSFILAASLFLAAPPAHSESPAGDSVKAEESTSVAKAAPAKISPLMQQIAKERSLSKQEKAVRPPAFQPFGTLTNKNTIYFLMLAFGGLFVAKKMQQQKGTDPLEAGIQVLSRKSLGSKTALLIVDAQGERFLLSQTGEDVQLLSPLELSTYAALNEATPITQEAAALQEVTRSNAGGKSVAV